MMTRTTLCLGVLATFLNCSWIAAAEPAQLHVGQHCEITTKAKPISWTSTSTKTYLGKVAAVSAKEVVLADVSVMQRIDSRAPVLHRIPYVNRLFKNIGIAQSHLGEEHVTVSPDEIETVRDVAAADFQKRTASAKTSFIERE